MLRVCAVTPLEGRSVRLTLSDGTDVERDLTDLLDGPVFVRIAFTRRSANCGPQRWRLASRITSGPATRSRS